MILETDYRSDGDLSSLVNYIKRDSGQDVAVKAPDGRELSDTELRRLVDRSQDQEMERQLIFAPDPQAELSKEEIDRRTRQTLREWTRGKHSVEAVYAVHDGHAHVAATGDFDDLAMYEDDIRDLREQSADIFRDNQRKQQIQRIEQAERHLDREHDRTKQRGQHG